MNRMKKWLKNQPKEVVSAKCAICNKEITQIYEFCEKILCKEHYDLLTIGEK